MLRPSPFMLRPSPFITSEDGEEPDHSIHAAGTCSRNKSPRRLLILEVSLLPKGLEEHRSVDRCPASAKFDSEADDGTVSSRNQGARAGRAWRVWRNGLRPANAGITEAGRELPIQHAPGRVHRGGQHAAGRGHRGG